MRVWVLTASSAAMFARQGGDVLGVFASEAAAMLAAGQHDALLSRECLTATWHPRGTAQATRCPLVWFVDRGDGRTVTYEITEWDACFCPEGA